MKPRAQLDRELDELQAMLPPWREKLRHEAQFWPQFEALADAILSRAATPTDREHGQRRITAMLAANQLENPPHLRCHPEHGEGSAVLPGKTDPSPCSG